MHVRLGLREIRLGKWLGGDALIDQRHDQKQQGGDDDDHAQMRMDQEDHEDEQRGKGHVEEGNQRARDKKAAQLLQVSQGLILAPRAVQRGGGGGAQDGCPQFRGDFHGGAHQHEPADRIEHGLQDHSRGDDDRQHDQRVGGAACQHPVRDLEQIDRNGEDQHIRGAGHHHDHAEVAPDRADTLPQSEVKILGTHAFVKGRPLVAAAALTRNGFAGAGHDRTACLTLDGDAGQGCRAGVAQGFHPCGFGLGVGIRRVVRGRGRLGGGLGRGVRLRRCP